MQYDLQELNEKERPKAKNPPQTNPRKQPPTKYFLIKMNNCIGKLPFVSIVLKVDILVTVSPGDT